MIRGAAAAHHSLGLALIRAKRYDEAAEELKTAAELDPGQARYAYVYAVALRLPGKGGEARGVLEKALEASPSNVQVLSMLLQSAMKSRDPARALPYAERLRTLLPDDPGMARLAAQLQAAAGRTTP